MVKGNNKMEREGAEEGKSGGGKLKGEPYCFAHMS